MGGTTASIGGTIVEGHLENRVWVVQSSAWAVQPLPTARIPEWRWYNHHPGARNLGDGGTTIAHLRTLRTKDKRDEGPLRGTPFVQEIQDAPIPSYFQLPMLEVYDGSSDPTEHVAVFHTQMTPYSMSDAIMCRAFPTTLRGTARG
ncbi:hypothetical protein BHE74_00031229 [Ensete ventricosum]|nr:hypothetical protein BHE74_00031229 [Ensete ventricosum]